jgi:predicted ATP-grasp superfamily ATP-dependent carboligase
LAELTAFLAVALSGRALAVAARRAAARAYVLDLFGDTDTRASAVDSRVVAGSIEHGFDADALLAAAAELAPPDAAPPFRLVYGSGLEDRPELLARLSAGRRLYGNRPETVAITKDPRTFFGLLERLGIPCPATSFTPPADPAGWLSKRVGASGGSHVAPAAGATAASPDRYFQRRVPGRPIGVSFLADGRRAVLVGFGEQWPWRGSGGAFRFGGAFQPAPVAEGIRKEIPTLLDAMVRELGLVGLNSLDMLVDGERYWVIEVNPRPGANLDIFDGSGPMPLFAAHVEACGGRLPERWSAPGEAHAMAVVYAERPARVPVELAWDHWVADRPAPGARIAAGAPICTVLATAATPALVRQLIDRRIASVLSRLVPDNVTDQPVHPHAITA